MFWSAAFEGGTSFDSGRQLGRAAEHERIVDNLVPVP
jgi:hypothetical protein